MVGWGMSMSGDLLEVHHLRWKWSGMDKCMVKTKWGFK